MIKEAIKFITENAVLAANISPFHVNKDGLEYRRGDAIAMRKPVVENALSASTLRAVADWVAALEAPPESLIINIISPSRVEIISRLFGPWMQQHRYLVSTADLDQFNFGHYINLEQFIIELQTKFTDTDDRAAIIQALGAVTGENVKTLSDDEVSQAVVAKDDIGRPTEATLKLIVSLSPWRTFPDIAQPSSDFLLHLRKGSDGMPQATLFSADGGKWRIDAIDAIAENLRMTVPDSVTIIA